MKNDILNQVLEGLGGQRRIKYTLDRLKLALTKNDIILSVCEDLGFSKQEAKQTIESLLEIIKGALENGENLLIRKFGKFSVRHKRERVARNPKTNDLMTLRARRVVIFKCSDTLKNKVNGKP